MTAVGIRYQSSNVLSEEADNYIQYQISAVATEYSLQPWWILEVWLVLKFWKCWREAHRQI